VRNTNTVPIPKTNKSSACSNNVDCIKRTLKKTTDNRREGIKFLLGRQDG
jgi:hypothetical protein